MKGGRREAEEENEERKMEEEVCCRKKERLDGPFLAWWFLVKQGSMHAMVDSGWRSSPEMQGP
jgi:hypothetical protein